MGEAHQNRAAPGAHDPSAQSRDRTLDAQLRDRLLGLLGVGLFARAVERVDPRALAHRERQPLRARRNLRRGRVAHPQEPRHCRALALLRLQSASHRAAQKHQKRQMARRARHQSVPRNNSAVLRTKQPCNHPPFDWSTLHSIQPQGQPTGRRCPPRAGSSSRWG